MSKIIELPTAKTSCVENITEVLGDPRFDIRRDINEFEREIRKLEQIDTDALMNIDNPNNLKAWDDLDALLDGGLSE